MSVNNGDEESKNLLDPFREYMQLTIELVLVEQEAALAELVRVEAILSEAATQLRESFTEIDNLISQGLSELPDDNPLVLDKDQELSVKSQLSDQYRNSIMALQFEDIVSQIIGHTRARGRGIDEILRNVKRHLTDLDSAEWNSDNLLRAIETSREDIERFRGKMATTNPVAQGSLKSGSIDLF